MLFRVLKRGAAVMRSSVGRSWLRRLLALVILAVSTGPSWGQDPPEPEPAELDDVLVQGSLGGVALREQVETFVDAVTSPPPGRGPARWHELAGVCVGVVNLRRDAAQIMADRVSQVAIMLDLPVGEPGCSPNVVIVATDDASALARALVERSPNAFRPRYGGAAGSRRQLERFMTTDRPVRWWHVAMPVAAETGLPTFRLPGSEPIPPRVRGDGLLTTRIRNELRRAYVIIDISQVEHLTLQQLSDYVAMAAFAQIDPDAEVGSFSTILNVVGDPAGAQEMTDWDRAYLAGLYGSELRQRRPDAQLGDVAGIMLRDRRRAGEAEAETETDAPESEPDGD